MKEVIGAIMIVIGIYAGAKSIKSFHDSVRREALGKAAKGMPSLSDIHRGLTGRK